MASHDSMGWLKKFLAVGDPPEPDGTKVKEWVPKRGTAARVAPDDQDAPLKGKSHSFVVHGWAEAASVIASPETYTNPDFIKKLTANQILGPTANQPAKNQLMPLEKYRAPAINQTGFSQNFLPIARGYMNGPNRRYAQVSTTARELTEYGYSPVILDQDIKYYIDRTPTAHFIVETIARDTWREGCKTNNDRVNEVLEELKHMGWTEKHITADISNRAHGIGIVVYGVRDGLELDEPLGQVVDDIEGEEEDGMSELPRPPMGGAIDGALEFLEAFTFEEIQEFKWQDDQDSSDYGRIISVRILLTVGDKTEDQWVHASRCTFVKEDQFTKGPLGRRALEPVMHEIELLEQTQWAAVQAYYERVVPPMLVRISEGVAWGPKQKARLDAAFNEFKTGVRQYLAVEGVEITPLSAASSMIPVTDTFELLISRIAVGTGVPARKITLTARGAVSESEEDRREYEGMIQMRQRTFAEKIVRGGLTIMLHAGILEQEDMVDLQFDWNALLPLNRMEVAQLEAEMANARMLYFREFKPLPAALDYEITTNKEMLALSNPPEVAMMEEAEFEEEDAESKAEAKLPEKAREKVEEAEGKGKRVMPWEEKQTKPEYEEQEPDGKEGEKGAKGKMKAPKNIEVSE